MNRKSPFFPSPYDPPLRRFKPREQYAPGNSEFSYNPRRQQFNEFHAPERSAPFSGFSHTGQLHSSARGKPFYSPHFSQTKNKSSEPYTWRGLSSNYSLNFSQTQMERSIPNRRTSNYSVGYSYNQNDRAAEINAAGTSHYNYEPGAARPSTHYHGTGRDMPGEYSMYSPYPTITRNNAPTNPDSRMSTSTIPPKRNKKIVHKCEICNEIFSKRRSLNRHNEIFHNIYGPKFTFPCGICGRKFKNNGSLFKHKINTHGKEPEGNTNIQKPSEKCEVENLNQISVDNPPGEKSGVENPSEISEVQNSPEESEVQKPAEKSEDQKDSYDTNLFANNPKAPYFSTKRFCELCYQIIKFCDKGGMAEHMKTRHNPDFEFQCLKCQRTFEEESELGLHIQGRGKCITGRKPTAKELLYGIDPNVKVLDPRITKESRKQKMCVLCSKDLSQTNEKGLRLHMKDAHNPNYEFECGGCRKTFAEEHLLKKHRCEK